MILDFIFYLKLIGLCTGSARFCHFHLQCVKGPHARPVRHSGTLTLNMTKTKAWRAYKIATTMWKAQGSCNRWKEYLDNEKWSEDCGNNLNIAVDHDSDIFLHDDEDSSANYEKTPSIRHQNPTYLPQNDEKTKKKKQLDSISRNYQNNFTGSNFIATHWSLYPN